MNGLLFDQAQWRKLFDGWNVVDVSVRSQDSFYFLLRESQFDDTPTLPDLEYKSRCVAYFGFLPADQPRLVSFDLEFFNRPMLTTGFGTSNLGTLTQVLVAKPNGQVFARGSGKDGMEWVVESPSTVLNIRRLKTVDSQVYAVGSDRNVFQRRGINDWEILETGLLKASTDESKTMGFHDISGFGQNDLYAVGGAGDVWRSSSEGWIQCAFPSNLRLLNVCCAGDGNVYIATEDGSVFVGSGDRWSEVSSGQRFGPYNDLIWFANSLCLVSDLGFFRLFGGDVLRSPDEPYSGRADVHDGVLLVASARAAWVNDGSSWRTVLWPYDSEQG
jgi:hypothetical protein